jgi:F0F1-type ATP synthase delta subunit
MASSTSLSKEMLKTFDKLNTEEQKSILQMVKTFLQGRKNGYTPQSIEEYNQELKAALKAAKKGEVTSVAKLEEEMKLW